MADTPCLEKLMEVITEFVHLDEGTTADSEIKYISGWDSITNVNILLSLEETFNIEIPLADLVQVKTIRDIAYLVENQRGRESLPGS